jgi:16S rRNA A1518/A1519 N6-dimethyltransferase RsmA/KsgA/DIM1 with predicted DNA glycosylase/AP lyase activity
VLDIGAGTGVITEELSKYAKQVIAYELDFKYWEVLKGKFNNTPNVIVKNEDFLDIQLPKKEFKIFSNIPFSLTSDIINKITDLNSKLGEAFIFVQKESAERYLGKPGGGGGGGELFVVVESVVVVRQRIQNILNIILLCMVLIY